MSGALLALELSPSPCSLAVQAMDGTVHAREFAGERGRALLHEVDTLLEHAGVGRQDLRGILVGVGPGSYTGLRIACTAARMLGYALEIPCGGIGSFEAAIARHARQHDALDQDIHLILDAYRGEYYHGCGRFDGAKVQLSIPPRVIARDDLPDLQQDAIVLCDPRLDEALSAWQPARYFPHAEETLLLGQAMGVHADGSGFDALSLPEPLYLRAAAFRS